MYGKNFNLLVLLILVIVVAQFVFPVSAEASCKQGNESSGTVIIGTVEGIHTLLGRIVLRLRLKMKVLK